MGVTFVANKSRKTFNYQDYFIPHIYAFILFLVRELDWILEEFWYFHEGHTVSKFLVFLVFMYIYSFVTMCFDICYSSFIIFKTLFHRKAGGFSPEKLKDTIFNIFQIRIGGLQILKVVAALVFTELAILTWKYVLFGFVCEHYYNPKLCETSIGQFSLSLRINVCGNEEIEVVSPACQKLVQHLPHLTFIILVVIMGNLIVPEMTIFLEQKTSNTRHIKSRHLPNSEKKA